MISNLRRIGIEFALLLVALLQIPTALASSYCSLNDPYCSPVKAVFCDDWSFSADALYWKPCEDGLAFGTSVSIPVSKRNKVKVNSKIQQPHFRWEWGYRLGVTHQFPCECFEIALYWTHFDAHAKATNETPFNANAPPTRQMPRSFFVPGWGLRDIPQINQPEARWKLRFDCLDIEFARHFCIISCLTLRPHIGVRALWINQRFRINDFSRVIFTPGRQDPIHITRDPQQVRLTTDYEGAGMRGGVDSSWDLGCGLSLYGSAAASIIFGHYEIDSKDDYFTILGESTSFFAVRQQNGFCACRGVLDTGLGIRWKHCACDCLDLTLQVGWEHHMFLNQNNFEDFVQLNTIFDPTDGTAAFSSEKNPQLLRGDLCLKGLTFSLQLDY